MAQIYVFGRVMHELVPKEGQSKQQYVCFDLMERSGNTPPDYYQVWARGDDVTRLMRLKVKKGSMIWLTGSQKLVDVRQKDGTTVKKLKITKHSSAEPPFEINVPKYPSSASLAAFPFTYSARYLMTQPPMTE